MAADHDGVLRVGLRRGRHGRDDRGLQGAAPAGVVAGVLDREPGQQWGGDPEAPQLLTVPAGAHLLLGCLGVGGRARGSGRRLVVGEARRGVPHRAAADPLAEQPVDLALLREGPAGLLRCLGLGGTAFPLLGGVQQLVERAARRVAGQRGGGHRVAGQRVAGPRGRSAVRGRVVPARAGPSRALRRRRGVRQHGDRGGAGGAHLDAVAGLAEQAAHAGDDPQGAADLHVRAVRGPGCPQRLVDGRAGEDLAAVLSVQRPGQG